MRAPHLAGALAAFLLAALLCAPGASAVEAPHCDNEVWSRPGLSRSLEIPCWATDHVRVAMGPADGFVSSTRFDGLDFHFDLTTNNAPADTDRLVLDLDGPAGSARQDIVIHNVPLSVNSPPQCEPVTTAKRSDGTEPVEVSFTIDCWDWEHDDFTLYGSGPGTHLRAPLLVHFGGSSLGLPNWIYRPAVNSGAEQAAYWAVDSQGARTPDVPISVVVGPAVDRLPTCITAPAYPLYDPHRYPIYMRAGATRRFGMQCEDEDGDSFEPALLSATRRGKLTVFAPDAGWSGGWGFVRNVDGVYVPYDDWTGEDRFEVAAIGARGQGPTTDVRMVTRPLSDNRGGGCGGSGGETTPGKPVVVEVDCEDEEGDALSATVTSPPEHGTADAPVVTPAKFGRTAIRLRYTPEAGFEGIDYATVRIEDGHGYSVDWDFMLVVRAPSDPPIIDLPPVLNPPVDVPPVFTPPGVPSFPGGPTAAAPSKVHGPGEASTGTRAVGEAPARTPAAQARRALHTRSVRLVRRLGTARVYAPRRRPRAGRRVRALAVTCLVSCKVRNRVRIAGIRGLRRGRLQVEPGRARVVTLRFSQAERRTLRARRASRAVFRLLLRPVTGGRHSGRVALRLRG